MKKILCCLLVLTSFYSNASWVDTSGKISSIVLYKSNIILVNLSVSGADVAECSSKRTFAVSASLSPEARSRMYAMLLSRQATGGNVVVSYSDVGGCEPYGSDTNAYRQIVRLR